MPKGFSLSHNLYGLLVEMRPQEWVKNLLVFAGLIFSRSLLDAGNITTSIFGFAIFCLASSGIYIFNDLCDLENDRQHPTKSKRPLASGSLNVNVARVAMVMCFGAAVLGALRLNALFALIIGVYLVTFLAYSVKLKQVVILDVVLIASGFVLRAISGAILIGVAISEWLVLCTSMVALLIGFGKRYHELALLEDTAGKHRANLDEYSTTFLRSMMNICGAAAVITYALYTRDENTVARLGSQGMLFTIPFVVYGVFRYLFLVHESSVAGNPVKILFYDQATRLNFILWVTAVVLVIYFPLILQWR